MYHHFRGDTYREHYRDCNRWKLDVPSFSRWYIPLYERWQYAQWLDVPSFSRWYIPNDITHWMSIRWMYHHFRGDTYRRAHRPLWTRSWMYHHFRGDTYPTAIKWSPTSCWMYHHFRGDTYQAAQDKRRGLRWMYHHFRGDTYPISLSRIST